MSRTSATYVITHGVAKSFKDDLKEKLKGKFFSLNVDEATNNAMDKIINILIQYYDEDTNRTVFEHLGSRRQNLATAKHIFEDLTDVLREFEFDWTQVISCLMDNCATMRGSKGGVETLIREQNPNLLDISGCTVHMVSNAAKELMKPFSNYLENICSELYYDIDKSPKAKELFSEIQSLLNFIPTKTFVRPITSRFLQMAEVSTRVLDLMDPCLVYYYSFLSEEEKVKYSLKLDKIYNDHGVTTDAISRISIIQEDQAKSSCSSSRKDCIIVSLFRESSKLVLMLQMYKGLLETFTKYVKTFQSEKPLVHILYIEMVQLLKDFMSLFIGASHIPDDSVQKLLKLDIADENIQKSDKNLSVGRYAHCNFQKLRLNKGEDHWTRDLLKSLRKGFIMAGQMLLRTLPLKNVILKTLRVLDPLLIKSDQAPSCFDKLANMLPNVLSEDERGALSDEVTRFQVDSDVCDLAGQYANLKHKDCRLDSDFWSHVFKLNRYPSLKKLVCSLLSLFSGPLIEATFNIMDDIIEKDRAKMTVENYEAVAIVKTGLKRMMTTSTALDVNKRMRRSCINAYGQYTKFLKEKKEKKQQKQQQQMKAAILEIRKRKALKLKRLQTVAKTMQEKKKCRK